MGQFSDKSAASDLGQQCRLLVSIINYKTPDMTIACVRSVLEDVTNFVVKIVVVDNASDDGSVEKISSWISENDHGDRVTLVRSPENGGFSSGHNQGLRFCDADYYLVLNSDALLRPGFCQTICDAADEVPSAGFVTPLLEWEDGAAQISHFRLPSPASELIRSSATGVVTKMLRRYDVPLSTSPEANDVGWASFACILLKGKMVAEIGQMDEGYFLYFEDTEYCLRARRAGWGIHHVPAARAIHFRGGSAPVKALAKAKQRLPAYYYASRTRFLFQAYGQAGLFAANFLWLLGHMIASFRRLIGKPTNNQIAHEASDIWINFFRPLDSSKALETSRDSS